LIDLEKQAESEIKKSLAILKNNGYETSQPRKGNYCFEISISSKSDKLKLLIYFGKKGIKKVLQGNRDSAIFSNVNSLLFEELPFEKPDFEEPREYIGTDESGKGDFFGPLVIAGVFVDIEKKKKLDEIGVKDSKLISHGLIRNLAESIKKISGQECFNIVIINPPRYNELYAKFGNLNKLLAWGHAKVLENILNQKESVTAISDKFGDERLILESLQEKGKRLQLHQFHKAEKYTAVAAASILARDRFNDWFDKQKKELMIDLPKGSSQKVKDAARQIKAQYSDEILHKLTKAHFKITGTL
jgi:ribonuclease HIII